MPADLAVIRAPFVWKEVPGVNSNRRSKRRCHEVLKINISLTLNLSFGLCRDWLQVPFSFLKTMICLQPGLLQAGADFFWAHLPCFDFVSGHFNDQKRIISFQREV